MIKFYGLSVILFLLTSSTPVMQLTLAQSYSGYAVYTSSDSGNIIVSGNSTYSLENGFFDLGSKQIIVKDNGTLIIENATVKSGLKGRTYLIVAHDNAHIIIVNTAFSGSASMLFADNGVVAKIINSASLEDLKAKEGSFQRYYNVIGIGWGGPSVTVVDSTFGSIDTWGRGAKVRVISSSFASGFITGNSSITLINTSIRSYEVAFGSTWTLLGPINLTLSISNGPIRYWNVYRNTTISSKPFNLTIINSSIWNWRISVGSAVVRKSFLKLYNSSISYLELSNTVAVIENSNITHSLDTDVLSDMGCDVSIFNSRIGMANVLQLSSLLIDNSSTRLNLIIYKGNKVVFRNLTLHSGYIGHISLGEHVGGIKFNVTINNSTINGLDITTAGNVTLYLENSHIGVAVDGWDSSTVVVPSNAALKSINLHDNASTVRQVLLKAILPNGTGVKDINIKVYRGLEPLRSVVTDDKGFATLNLTFTRLNESAYRSPYEAVVQNTGSNNSRLYGVRRFNMTEEQPILVEVKIRYFVTVSSKYGTAVILQSGNSSGWFYEGSEVTLSVNPKAFKVPHLLELKFRYFINKVTGNIIKDEVEVNGPINAIAYWTIEYDYSGARKPMSTTPAIIKVSIS